ncbi:Alpha/Beta hydrolase protein [Schizothecium vesticola]|uniref:Alpha/Beta hydrolase protein n=1 Tax=Schizothecium vesticola TaxID=314040 RepID=A0AA40EIL9_9PEZI|nr:Alpha/Beta hydrolase protein [Schizothecium vesticola]
MLSLDEIGKLSDPDPELAAILRTGGPGAQAKPMLSLSDITQARAFTRLFHSIASATKPGASSIPYRTTEIQVRVRDGTLLPGRVYTPKRPSAGGCPGMYVCHGGGYVIGELDGQEWICAIWAGLGGVAVDVQYRHAPEWVFPVPLEDAYDGFLWMVGNLQELKISPDRGLVVAGDSTGGDMAMVIAHLYALQQTQSPPLTGLYLGCPVAMDKNIAPERYRDYYLSMEQNAKGPALTAESINFILSVYKPDLTSPLFFPILFPDHSKLPKTYLQVCGMDPLRDGGLILEQLLRDSGVQTRLQVYPGLPHCFWGVFIHARFTKKHKQDSTDGLSWLLSG